MIVVATLYYLLILMLLVGVCRLLWGENGARISSQNCVSVVVAFRNEKKNLPQLIESLKKQTLPNEQWEAIFVDDGSTDGGAELLNSADEQFRYVNLEGVSGKKQAVIKGVSLARHNIIALTDADCVPSKTWLSGLLQKIEGKALVQGSVNIVPGKTVISHFDSLDYASLMSTSAGSFGLGCPVVASASNMAFRKDLIEISADVLNTKYASGDDMFLLHRTKQNKLPLAFVVDNSVDVNTHFDGGFKQMVQRRKRWASKAKGYSDRQTIAVAIIVLLFNLGLVCLAIMAVLGLYEYSRLIAFWVLKLTVDLLLLFTYLHAKKQTYLLAYFLPLQIIYPFYTVFSAVGGLFRSGFWR